MRSIACSTRCGPDPGDRSDQGWPRRRATQSIAGDSSQMPRVGEHRPALGFMRPDASLLREYDQARQAARAARGADQA